MPVARHRISKKPNVVPVHREHHPVGHTYVLRFGGKPANARDRQQQAEGSGDERQQDALDQELAHDVPATCTDGHPHAHFAGPARRLREQQVRHVRTRNQHHEPDRSHQRPEQQPICGPACAGGRVGVRPQVFVGFRVLSGQTLATIWSSARDCYDRDTVGKPAHGKIASACRGWSVSAAAWCRSGARYQR